MPVSSERCMHESGYLVRMMRERAGLTRAEAARGVGLSGNQLHKIEDGKGRASFERLLSISHVVSAGAAETARLIALDLAERVGRVPEHLQSVFLTARPEVGRELVAAKEFDPDAGESDRGRCSDGTSV